MKAALLDNRQAQGQEASLDHDLWVRAHGDLEWVLGSERGRAFVYWLVFQLGRLESASFDPSIKDGVAMAQVMARNEGIREVAAVLAARAQQQFPEAWDQMILEARGRALAVRQTRDEIRHAAARQAREEG